MECQNVVVDKVDLLMALEFGSDLKKIDVNFNYRCVLTTTDMRADKEKLEDEMSEFKEIKDHFLGANKKALIIKLDKK